MSEPYLGQIIMTTFGFPSQGWMLCDGSLLQISTNPQLFGLLGTTFGGDGKTTFALPDLRGRTLIGVGTAQIGASSEQFAYAQTGGSEEVTLTVEEMPPHAHMLSASSEQADLPSPVDGVWAVEATSQLPCYATDGGMSTMSQQAIGLAGGGQGHPNMQPYLVINYCINTSATANVAAQAISS